MRPIVLGSLLLAGWLVPQREELVKRLLEDGHHLRAIAVAEGDTPSIPEAHPITILKALPALDEIGAPAPAPLDRLRAALLPEAKDTSIDFAATIQQVNDIEGSWKLVKSLRSQLDDTQLGKVYLGLGQAALAEGNPKLAADIFTDGAAQGVHSEALLVRQTAAYRWSGQPQGALDALEAWQALAPLPHGLRDMPFQLYRELNRPDKALDVYLKDLPSQLKATQADLLCELASQAGQMDRVLPLVEGFLKSQPAGGASLQDLAKQNVKAEETWQKLAKRFSLTLEWGGHPLEAFRWHQKLAVLGDRDALKRILTLNPGLNLDGEVLPVLEAVVPVPDQPELTLTLAQMQADAGEYEAADRNFAAWLEQHPRDVAALKLRAAVAEEQSRLDDALSLYTKALELDSKDLTVQKEIADIQIARGEFRAAFEIYDHLPEKSHDNFTLENYALLAESLAEYPAYNRALVARMHRLKQPTTQDYLELGRSFDVVGEQEQEVKTYEIGLRRNPQSHILRIELAHTLRLMDRYSEALAVLGRPEMKSDMQAMQLYIELAVLSEDYAGALAFLGRGIEEKFAFGPEVRLDLGQIYLQSGYAKEADELLTSVPDEPALWPLLAAARYKAGNFPSAEKYQRKYLTALTVPDPQGWLLLGDIYKAEGREAEAQQAYSKSLSLMEDKLEEPEPPPPSPKAAIR
jgi:tetratricopeptide (TPR) repeat protein